MKWVTKDGRELKISKMSTTHIKNCINLMFRNDRLWENDDPADWALYNSLKSEYRKRIKRS